MKLKIMSIENGGDAKDEYVRLKVLEDCNLIDYALVDTTFTADGKVSNKNRHFYWFPHKDVKKNEVVRLYSSIGDNVSSTSNTDIMIHKVYWNLGSPVWNNEGDKAVLFEIKDKQEEVVDKKKGA